MLFAEKQKGGVTLNLDVIWACCIARGGSGEIVLEVRELDTIAHNDKDKRIRPVRGIVCFTFRPGTPDAPCDVKQLKISKQ